MRHENDAYYDLSILGNNNVDDAQNKFDAKLASMLTGYTIDVFRELNAEEEEDVQLDDFADEIEPWVIEELKKIGLTTASQVLNAPREMIIKEADLEEETVDDTLRILAAEFEDEEEEEQG